MRRDLQQFGFVVPEILCRGEVAVRRCREARPDILLLGERLAGALDGIATTLALESEQIFIPTIYLTAAPGAAPLVRACDTRPHALLPRPYDRSGLHRAISQAVRRHHTPATPPAPPAEAPPMLSDRIFVRQKDDLVKLLLNDIRYVSAERSYCLIHATDAEHLLSMPLGKLAAQLPSPDFLRVHRSYIVNLRHIDRVADHHLMIGEHTIPVGKHQYAALTQRVHLVR